MRLLSASSRTRAALGLGAVLGVLACARTGLLVDESASPPIGGGPDASKPKDGAPDDDAAVVQPKACIPGQFSFDLASSQVLFVIDRSGSMRFSLDGEERNPPFFQSRWRILERALTPLLQGLETTTSLGATFFPGPQDDLNPEATACLVPSNVAIPPGLGTASQILRVFTDTVPEGGTPTAQAVRTTTGFLNAAARKYVARFMVLATDGAPNCNADNPADPRTCVCTAADPRACTETGDVQNCLDDDATIDAIGSALNVSKVPTYVIGIGSSNQGAFEGTLDRMAVAGGRPKAQSPKYLQATTEGELQTAVDTIRAAVAKCVYVTPSRPDDPDAIVVNLDGIPVPRDKNRENGWDWLDQEYGALSFFGAACDSIKSATAVGGIVACKDAGK